jgi:hypothetical protein
MFAAVTDTSAEDRSIGICRGGARNAGATTSFIIGYCFVVRKIFEWPGIRASRIERAWSA